MFQWIMTLALPWHPGSTVPPWQLSSSLHWCRAGWHPGEWAALQGHWDAPLLTPWGSDSSSTKTVPNKLNSFSTLTHFSFSMIIIANSLRWWERNNQGKNVGWIVYHRVKEAVQGQEAQTEPLPDIELTEEKQTFVKTPTWELQDVHKYTFNHAPRNEDD